MSEVVEGVVKIISSMNKRERRELLERLLMDNHINEDLADSLTILQRQHERTIPWEAVKRRLRRKHAIK